MRIFFSDQWRIAARSARAGVVRSTHRARVTTPLALASDAGRFATWQAQRQDYACHGACIGTSRTPSDRHQIHPTVGELTL